MWSAAVDAVEGKEGAGYCLLHPNSAAPIPACHPMQPEYWGRRCGLDGQGGVFPIGFLERTAGGPHDRTALVKGASYRAERYDVSSHSLRFESCFQIGVCV